MIKGQILRFKIIKANTELKKI